MGYGLFGTKKMVKPIYVCNYGNQLTRGIYAFHIDVESGELIKKKYNRSRTNPEAISKRDRFMYVCYKNMTGAKTDGGLWQYANMDLQFGLAAKVYYQGKTYVDSFVNQDRSYAYAVDYYNGEVVVIPILDQKIVKVRDVIKHEGHGLDPKRQTEAHPCFIEETPDHQYIYVCDLGTDEVVFYDVAEKGMLVRNEEKTIHVEPGSGPKKMIFSPNGKFAYLLNELSSTVSAYTYENGQLTYLHTLDTFPKDEYIGENLVGDIVITPRGDFVFVSNRGHDSVSVFEVDQETGKLTYREYIDTDENPRSMVIVEDQWLVVAAQKSGTIESFEIKRDISRGVLYETHYSYLVGEPVALIVGRDKVEKR